MEFVLREELYHPLLVHFPVALIITAAGLGLASFIKFKNVNESLSNSSRILSILAAISIWPAYLTGEMAEDIVNRVICDPTVTKLHSDWGFWTGIVASACALLAIATFFPRIKNKKFLIPALLIFQIICAGMVGYTGHLGASLTYTQAAAVQVPSSDCKEFN